MKCKSESGFSCDYEIQAPASDVKVISCNQNSRKPQNLLLLPGSHYNCHNQFHNRSTFAGLPQNRQVL
jgi:hypothetical protein